MEGLLGRASTRFLFVSFLPTAFFVAVLGFLLAAGAPSHQPDLRDALNNFHGLSLRDVIGLASIVGTSSVALNSIQTPIIQLLEGYWRTYPLGDLAFEAAVRRHHRAWNNLRDIQKRYGQPNSGVTYAMASAARTAAEWMPDDDDHLLPTTLGNTLRAGESRAGERYGLRTELVMPRLMPLLSQPLRDRLADGRNQLDAAARLCCSSLLATAASLALLLPTASWLLLPLALYLLSWVSYRAAIAAARTYCSNLAAAIDLHHLDLWVALHQETPHDLWDEKTRGELLSRHLSGEELDREEMSSIVWVAKPPIHGGG